MWRDTMGLFKDVLKNLPSGVVGALVRLSIIMEILIGLALVIALIVKQPTFSWGCLISMVALFIFISFFLVRLPGVDPALAQAQADRARRISPTVITFPGGPKA
jgi:uncharacterized membrane protein YphA (DoxX/SURF4 family)